MSGVLVAMVAALSVAAVPVGSDERFGAASSAALPGGALAVYGFAGYPEVRAGFRQGFQAFELAAEAGFDWSRARAEAVGIARVRLWEGGPLRLSVEGQAGAFGNAGATWNDRRNASGAGLRLGAGATLAWETGWPLVWFASLRAPMEFALTRNGATRIAPLLGGGAELAVGEQSFVLFGAGCGPDFRKPQSQAFYTRLAVEIGFGFGYRVF